MNTHSMKEYMFEQYRHDPHETPSTRAVAWAAGLFEGEGCVSIETRPRLSGRRPVYLQVGSTDLDVLEALQYVLGCGNIRIHRDNSAQCRRQGYLWQTARYVDVLRILNLLRPYMGTRRGQKFDEAIAELEKNPAHEGMVEAWSIRV